MTARRKREPAPAVPAETGGQPWHAESDTASEGRKLVGAAVQGAEPPDASSRLCAEISRISGGVCFLGFSRGKDSIAAWLRLKQFFHTIIPFHCASVPGLAFVDDSLVYYERVFETTILRFMDGACLDGVGNLFWQPPGSEEAVNALELWQFDKHDIIDYLRREMNLPEAWCAFGINMTDSLDRRIWVEKAGGRNDNYKTFYPCYDWKKVQIVQVIKEAGIMLPKDYTAANRTFAGLPAYRHLAHMREWAPDDYERLKLLYPMVEAELARQEFRRAKGPGTPRATAALGMVSARAIA